MSVFSFIDWGLEDFLRDSFGDVVKVKVSSWEEAEDWLLSNGEKYGWTNQGVRYFNWSEKDG